MEKVLARTEERRGIKEGRRGVVKGRYGKNERGEWKRVESSQW